MMVSLLLMTLVSALAPSLAHPPWAQHKHPHKSYSANPWGQYMVGEEFFKQDDHVTFEGDDHQHVQEEMPYTVEQDYGSYEKRSYPEVALACTQQGADLAGDPLANLEHVDFWKIMTSRRYQKTPDSIMFRKLFKYISGGNQEGVEIPMTAPVAVLSKTMKEDKYGDVVMLMMCFYLPSMYQPNHEDFLPSHEHPARSKRHDSVTPPKPLEGSQVFIYTRPQMEVYVRRFAGFAFTAKTWQAQKKILQEDLIGKNVNGKEYFGVGYDPPMQLENRRNEVWIQSMDENAEDLWPSGPDFVDGIHVKTGTQHFPGFNENNPNAKSFDG